MKVQEISRKLHVLVFRTNLDMEQKVNLVCRELVKMNGIYCVNVDLEDWEKVLRVECAQSIGIMQIQERMSQLGFECAELAT